MIRAGQRMQRNTTAIHTIHVGDRRVHIIAKSERRTSLGFSSVNCNKYDRGTSVMVNCRLEVQITILETRDSVSPVPLTNERYTKKTSNKNNVPSKQLKICSGSRLPAFLPGFSPSLYTVIMQCWWFQTGRKLPCVPEFINKPSLTNPRLIISFIDKNLRKLSKTNETNRLSHRWWSFKLLICPG